MLFKINGIIREKESRLGVPGLMVRAYDKDLLFDDLLGTAVTDADGRFELVYSDQDFRELFDLKPDLYLSVYTPPYKLVLQTLETVRWGASTDESFEVEISQNTLGHFSPSRPDDYVDGSISVSEQDLSIEIRAGYHYPVLPRFITGGKVGSPALPEQTQYVILPLGGSIKTLEIMAGEPITVSGRVNPYPAQEIRTIPTGPRAEDPLEDRFKSSFRTLDKRYFTSTQQDPKSLVKLDRVEELNGLLVAMIKVRPVQYDFIKKTYLFYPDLRYKVKFDSEKAQELASRPGPKATRHSKYFERVVVPLMDNDLVYIPRFPAGAPLFPPTPEPPPVPAPPPDPDEAPVPEEPPSPGSVYSFEEDVPYLIITDNTTWEEYVHQPDGSKAPPQTSVDWIGDIRAEFERLAEWKNSRGVRTVVVSVSEIVNGLYGDFTEQGFARDLPEVIRNFVKHAHEHWGTQYLLLGGNQTIVSMRRFAGYKIFKDHFLPSKDLPVPKEGDCYVDTSRKVAKLFCPQLQSKEIPLSTHRGGHAIPHCEDVSDPDVPQWYHTTEQDFRQKRHGFTRLPADHRTNYLIVEGPLEVIDDDYYWVVDNVHVWSDLYYSSLEGPYYSIPGKHDFDSTDSGLYGQYHTDLDTREETQIDKFDFLPDVWVGRAPIYDVDTARIFVDKVLTYERLETPDGSTEVNTDYLRKILFGTTYWGRWEIFQQEDASIPPEEEKYTHFARLNETRIHMKYYVKLSNKIPSRRLICRRKTSVKIIPYNISADKSNPGWHFTNSDYSVVQNKKSLYIRVFGSEEDINPVDGSFLFDEISVEQAAKGKEQIRQKLRLQFPKFNKIERLYEEIYDLNSPPPLSPISKERINGSIDQGFHFISLSGHGSPSGCCLVDNDHQFSNAPEYSIVYAHSCQTASVYNGDDYSLGEKMICREGGGAVAYIGYTKWGLLSVDWEDFFWCMLKSYRQLGPAVNWRGTLGDRSLWMMYVMTLYGDPEMPVWTDLPRLYRVHHPRTKQWSETEANIIEVQVLEGGNPLGNQRVTLMSEWLGSQSRPQVLESKSTNSNGLARFRFAAGVAITGKLSVTVTNYGFKPYVGTIGIR